LRGIVHAAGVFHPQTIKEMSWSDFKSVLRPKVAGTWVLHQLTRNLDLDFFVMFSSAASTWGSAQAGHYVAANHFMDVFAHLRGALRLPAQTINWGWWADSSMVSADAQKYFSAIGLNVLPQEQSLAALGHLLETDVVQKTVAAVDWSKYKPIFEAKRRRPFLDLIEFQPQTGIGTASAQGLALIRRLGEAAPVERMDLLIAYLQGQVALVMGLDPTQPPEPGQGFFQMGMNSLMAIELKTCLEADLGRTLPSTVAFEYPTIEALAGYIARDVLSLELAGPEFAGQSPEEVKRSEEMAELEKLTEDELIALVSNELRKGGQGE
jgi:acyl carrier protein